jgi:YesN/AraC family two-component response regulator
VQKAALWFVGDLKELHMDMKPMLLIVDDDAAIVRLIERVISRNMAGLFEVSTFSDPRAALDWINNNQCDILISDVEMPGIGGMDLLRAAKMRHHSIKTIFLTAHSSWERVAEAIELGATDYLIKPVDQSMLIKMLRRARNAISRPDAAERGRTLEDSTAALQMN